MTALTDDERMELVQAFRAAAWLDDDLGEREWAAYEDDALGRIYPAVEQIAARRVVAAVRVIADRACWAWLGREDSEPTTTYDVRKWLHEEADRLGGVA